MVEDFLRLTKLLVKSIENKISWLNLFNCSVYKEMLVNIKMLS